jgi:hypothetical protein
MKFKQAHTTRNKLQLLLLALENYSFIDACTLINIAEFTCNRYLRELRKSGYKINKSKGKLILINGNYNNIETAYKIVSELKPF